MGGEEKYVERLQHVMENDMIDLWNEPAFLTPFSFIYAGRPDLTSYWVRDNFKRYDFEKKSFPGDGDSGAMSSWYVFAAMGFL